MSTTAPLPPASGTVPNHLVWSIIVTILAFFVCCMSCVSFAGIITGIVAIVFGTKVNTLLSQGDLEGARRASRNARTWAWVTTGLLILGIVVFVVSLATLGVDGYMQQMEQFQQQIEANR
ncbi:CD225/dispanin family protein [Xanthomonas sp. 60]